MSTVLDKIVEHKKAEIERLRARTSVHELAESASSASPPRDFSSALRSTSSTLNLIAEVKKASPSAGLIRADFDPVRIARDYETAGAHAISVLTDEQFFQGHLSYLRDIRATVRLPVLRKDFIISEIQVVEARAAGADAVLLIAEILSQDSLTDLLRATHDWGMQALVELYDPANLDMVINSGAKVIGINNRDLRTFETRLVHTLDLVDQIPEDRVIVSESGINNYGDVEILRKGGADAMLVGESIMRSSDMSAKIAELLGR